MIFLFILIYFIICTLLFDVKINRSFSNLIYFSEYLCLVLLFGLRYRVGGDSLYYQNSYPYLFTLKDIPKVNLFDQIYQPLWYILNAVTKSVTNDFTFFQFVHTIIINTSIFYLINKYCEKRFLGVLFYYVFYCLYFNTEILRESLAVLLFVFAFPYISKKKYIHYYVLCIIAYMTHAFAMFTFIVPVLVYFFRKPIKLYHLLLIFVVLLTAPLFILDIIIKFSSLNKFILTQLEHYSKLDININGIIISLFNIVPILMVMFIQAKNPRSNKLFIPAVNLYFMMVLMSATLAGAQRLSNYFAIFYYFAVIESLIFAYKNIKIKPYFILGGLITFFLGVGIFYYYFMDYSKYYYGREAHFYNRYYPYHSIFEPEKDYRREVIFDKVMQEDLLKTK